MSWLRLGSLALLCGVALPLAACTDGDIRKGCKNWCRCHHGDQPVSSCRAACEKKLDALRERDRAFERQVAECLAAKGKRSCKQITLCGRGALTPPK
jgi:hypothetical protein